MVRISICFLDGHYDNYTLASDIPDGKHDNLYIYGIGMEGALYKSEYLFYPRFYVTEDDNYDITETMLVPYSHYEMDKLQTEDFITAALPDMLNDLSIPIFLLLLGEMSVDKAIQVVKNTF